MEFTVRLSWGTLSFNMAGEFEQVGDRSVPTPIRVQFDGADGQPAFSGLIESRRGVPRWTEMTLRYVEGGHDIRQKDLKKIDPEGWLEMIVSACAGVPSGEGFAFGASPESRTSVEAIREARRITRRKLTDDDLQQVADVYSQEPRGGQGRVQAAWGVSKATAERYVKRAKLAGLIESRKP